MWRSKYTGPAHSSLIYCCTPLRRGRETSFLYPEDQGKCWAGLQSTRQKWEVLTQTSRVKEANKAGNKAPGPPRLQLPAAARPRRPRDSRLCSGVDRVTETAQSSFQVLENKTEARTLNIVIEHLRDRTSARARIPGSLVPLHLHLSRGDGANWQTLGSGVEERREVLRRAALA